MDNKRQCNRCKVQLPLDQFKVKRSGDHYKQCISCNVKKTKWESNNKCEHGRKVSTCKDCQGVCICIHGRRRSTCKDCQGSEICKHNRRRSACKDCQGSGICIHNRERSKCKDCDGGSVCIHGRIRSICKDCGGGSVCIHSREKAKCKDCDPNGYLADIVRSRVRKALNGNKTDHSLEYVGCTIQKLRQHLENQFKDGMNWENQGEWHIDHIIPIKFGDPTLEELIERLHYTNLQPLWAEENIAKGNRSIG